MTSRRVSIHRAIWPYREPFRIAGFVFDHSDALVVEIGEGDAIGRGEGIGTYFLGDSIAAMAEAAETLRGPLERGLTRAELQDALAPGGARNAIDCALWDLEAKLADRPVWDLAGVGRRALKTVYTLSIASGPEELADRARAASGYSTLKIKLDADRPIERVAAVRGARPDAALVVDANQAFALEDLPSLLEAFQALGVAMVEQPLARGADEGLAGFVSPVPLCADESCIHMGELDAALARYDMINIKLDKCGGLTEALAIARATHAAGKRLMVGNMVGSSLSAAPALVVAQLCDLVDLDGPLHLRSDHLDGVRYEGESILAPSRRFWG